MYFDHAATSPCSQQLLKRLPFLAEKAAYNPSSSHSGGISTRKELQSVRRKVSDVLSCSEEEIYFTSGATEANNMVLRGMAQRKSGHIVSSNVEHDSVEKNLLFLEQKGYEVTRLSPDRLTTSDVLDALKENTFLVSIMTVQNELGSIYTLEGLGKELRKRGVYYHRDAVQSFGKIPFRPSKESVDFASFSGHKLGALKGLGILYVRNGIKLAPLFLGGGQERGLRAGTENTLGILSLGEVLAELNLEKNYGYVQKLKDEVSEGIMRLGGECLCKEGDSPYILALSFPLPAEVLLSALSMKGAYLSAGSACHAKSKAQARILPYLDPSFASGYLRLSLSPHNSLVEVQTFLLLLEETLKELKEYL